MKCSVPSRSASKLAAPIEGLKGCFRCPSNTLYLREVSLQRVHNSNRFFWPLQEVQATPNIFQEKHEQCKCTVHIASLFLQRASQNLSLFMNLYKLETLPRFDKVGPTCNPNFTLTTNDKASRTDGRVIKSCRVLHYGDYTLQNLDDMVTLVSWRLARIHGTSCE